MAQQKIPVDKISAMLAQHPDAGLAIETDVEVEAKGDLIEALKPGRPKKNITPEMIEILARINCTKEDIAFAFGVTVSTINRRFALPGFEEAYERGKAKGRIRLRLLQQKLANSAHGSAVNMAIHLSKHVLGETDKSAIELTGKDGGPVILTFREALRQIDAGQGPLIDVTPTKSELLPIAAKK